MLALHCICYFQLAPIKDSFKPVLEKTSEPTLPGLGASSSSSSVPSFLRTSTTVSSGQKPNSRTTTDPHAAAPPLDTLTAKKTAVEISSSARKPQVILTPEVQQTVQNALTTLRQSSSSVNPNTAFTGTATSADSSSSVPANPDTSHVTATATGQIPSVPSSKASLVDTSSVDQPQKLLLESIRKQTELLKQKIALTIGSQAANKAANKSAPQLNPTPGLVAPSGAGPISPGLQQAKATDASPASRPAPSSYSSHYYHSNFHMAAPNSAPQPSSTITGPVPPVGNSAPPLPPGPVPTLNRSMPNSDPSVPPMMSWYR